MTDRKFYKTIIPIEVLSEEPIPEDMPVEAIVQAYTNGDYSARELPRKETTLDGKQAVHALGVQASDPGFFRLDDEGNDAE